MKTAIITGADGGIGVEITNAVAQAGYHVVMACRNLAKAELKKTEILSAYPEGSIEVIRLDLSSLEAVLSFTAEIERKFGTVDLLMNNAGTIPTVFQQTADGFEQAVSVNYIAPYLLVRKLIPLMPEGARIVNMISCTYPLGRIDLPDFFNRGRKGRFRRLSIYSNTKLALVLFTLELSQRLRTKGITVNAADPGIVSTGIITMQKWFDPLADLFFRPLIKTPRQGAAPAIQLLLNESYAGITGQFFTAKGNKPIPPKYQNHPMQAQLWTETENKLRDLWTSTEQLE